MSGGLDRDFVLVVEDMPPLPGCRAAKALALVLGLASAVAAAPVAHARPPAGVVREINHLLAYIRDSGCAFTRNDSWNKSTAAEAHVRAKYDYLVKRDLIKTTEDFINGAATKSSGSGRPYEIRCGGESPLASNHWLTSELARYRAKASR